MAQKLGQFDASGFYEAIDATRQSRQLNWKEVAAAAGVSASTLTRMAQGKRPDVDSLAALTTWSGLQANAFIRSEAAELPEAEPLAMISTLLRGDRQLTPEGATALEAVIRAAYERLRVGPSEG
jgi:transcriptional regulator with XRE-family HTH domain